MKFFLLLFSFITSFTMAQNQERIVFINSYLHVGNGETMETATVGIDKGKIILIKNSLTHRINPSEWDTVIDLRGQHLYPGLVAPNSTLGLTEIDAVRATRDFDEVGIFNPHVRALIAYNVESDVIATVRSNGVLITQITPRGGILSGSSSVMHMDGWNWTDAAIRQDDGIHLNWPPSFPGRKSAVDKAEENKRKIAYEKAKREIYSFFENAKAYETTKKENKLDLRLEAMMGCFSGEKRIFIHANELQQLLDVIDFCRHFELKFPVIIGGYDSYLLLDQLRDAKIPVMLPRVHSLPENDDDPIDLPYKLPSLLFNANVLFCLQNEGDMEAMNARNVPFLAGHTTGYGLTKEQALQIVSLDACKILGIDKEYGSIEIGKNATLFISKGDALDMMTNHVTMALMNGKWVDLDDRQKQLYRKFDKKYNNQQKTE